MFKHPGTLMSPEMTLSLHKDKDANPIRQQAFQKLIRECNLPYKNMAIKVVDIGYGGKGMGHEECTKDGEMAYKAALLYWCTLEKRYADAVIDILDSWARVNKIFRGDNAPLEAAWSVCSMARAAELVKYAASLDVRQLWSRTESSFNSWLDSVIMPCLQNKDIWKWVPKGNWHYSIICARAQLAILREDKNEWQWCMKTYKETLPNTICFGHKCHVSETKRDITHVQFQLGGILQFPEMAYQQGDIALFDVRLKDILEYHAAIMMKEIPEGISAGEIKAPYGYWYEPIWEIGFHHFSDRLGLAMPKTERYLETIRPERICFHWGGGTLTHYKR